MSCLQICDKTNGLNYHNINNSTILFNYKYFNLLQNKLDMKIIQYFSCLHVGTLR